MKALFTLLFLMFAAVAFANDGTQQPGVTPEKNIAETKKAAPKPPAVTEYKKPAATKRICTSIDSRFGIGDYFVEIINKNNLRLVKLLLTE